ncbi:MAG: YMGG-like glycine zipper-containing protein [Myxococcota bacterium]
MVAQRVALVMGILMLASQGFAGSPVIYPAKGQDAAQQSKDEGECQVFAKQNTGIDPLALAGTASQPAPGAAPAESGQRAKTAAKGAAAGAVVGAVAGDAGKGAAVGAAAGTVAGGSRKRKAESDSQAAGQAQSANVQSQLATFNKAYSACLEGRGYTVK